jgi:6-pyruvoyltetrahydropterin/6-carboxytetrahydropterin synthase
VIIRKLFKFEGAHVVRGCSTDRCKYTVHGHSYRAEVLLRAHNLDNGQMVVDFGLVKKCLGPLFDAFDHTIVLWAGDDEEYLDAQKQHSQRWIELSINPSAEQLARYFLFYGECLVRLMKKENGEASDLTLHSVIVHETDTGYAQAFNPVDIQGFHVTTVVSPELQPFKEWLLKGGL